MRYYVKFWNGSVWELTAFCNVDGYTDLNKAYDDWNRAQEANRAAVINGKAHSIRTYIVVDHLSAQPSAPT